MITSLINVLMILWRYLISVYYLEYNSQNSGNDVNHSNRLNDRVNVHIGKYFIKNNGNS